MLQWGSPRAQWSIILNWRKCEKEGLFSTLSAQPNWDQHSSLQHWTSVLARKMRRHCEKQIKVCLEFSLKDTWTALSQQRGRPVAASHHGSVVFCLFFLLFFVTGSYGLAQSSQDLMTHLPSEQRHWAHSQDSAGPAQGYLCESNWLSTNSPNPSWQVLVYKACCITYKSTWGWSCCKTSKICPDYQILTICIISSPWVNRMTFSGLHPFISSIG